MKPIFRILSILVASAGLCSAQTGSNFRNFIFQVQLTGGEGEGTTHLLNNIAKQGESLSPLEINPYGARFELWTALNSPYTEYLLDTRYVGAYVPMADVVIRTEDPYDTPPRTRADRPFEVDIIVSGLLSGPGDPEPSKSVKLLRHVQSYGPNGTGIGIDRTQAILLSQAMITSNGTHTLTYALNSVPGANRAKVRGEERFSVFSLADYQAPESQLASKHVQIWPVADGSIEGLSDNQLIRFGLPVLTLTINDIYPDSRVYAQVYKGTPQLGTEGTVVPGSALIVNDSVPQSRVLTITDWDVVFEGQDGQWTMELLTATPFGIDRLDHVTFHVNRTIQMNGSVTTIE